MQEALDVKEKEISKREEIQELKFKERAQTQDENFRSREERLKSEYGAKISEQMNLLHNVKESEVNLRLLCSELQSKLERQIELREVDQRRISSLENSQIEFDQLKLDLVALQKENEVLKELRPYKVKYEELKGLPKLLEDQININKLKDKQINLLTSKFKSATSEILRRD